MSQKKFPMTVIAERLRSLREKAGLTQKELGEKLDISRGSVGFYENGERVPDIAFLDAAADYFEVSTEYLLGRTDIRNVDLSIKEICDKTGLSEKALGTLVDEKQKEIPIPQVVAEKLHLFSDIEILNYLLESAHLWDLIIEIKEYMYDSRDMSTFWVTIFQDFEDHSDKRAYLNSLQNDPSYENELEQIRASKDLSQYRCEKKIREILLKIRNDLLFSTMELDKEIYKDEDLYERLYKAIQEGGAKDEQSSEEDEIQKLRGNLSFVLNTARYKNHKKEGDPDGGDKEEE